MELFFRQEGNGFPIVIVHGLYGSSDNWLTIARNLSPDYTVYLIDQRNHGRSPNSDGHSYELMKNDLAEFFDRHKIEKAVVMGHSMGGKTAMNFASDFPERVEKLIVVDIAPKDYFLLNDENQYFEHKNILRSMLETDLHKAESRKQVEDFLNHRIGNRQVVQFLMKSIHRSHESHQFEWRLNLLVLYNNLDEIIRGVHANCFDDRLPQSAYPVLFIKGANSNYILPEDFAAIHRIYPEAQIVEIPHAGHWLHAEQPQLFLDTVHDFLNRKL